ncbi:MAG: lanthionine synthetase LanC family protein [Polyangiaceae bacterium]|jgi:lantibiotic modifying enzyme
MGLAQFVDDVVARLETTPVDLSHLAPEAVPGSIFTGCAGIAFFLHETARLRGRNDLVPLARRWLGAARTWGAAATPPEWNDHPFGVVVGRAGVPYVELLFWAREGDARGVLQAARAIDDVSRDADGAEGERRPTELLGGAAGVACAMRDVESRLPAGGEHDEARAVIARVRERETARVMAKYARPIALGPLDPLGFAHGVAGELWALVTLVGASDETVSARLRELQSTKQLDEEGLVYWPTSTGNETPNFLGTWCNGMAGHTLLWCEVARQLGTDASMAFAGQCAESSTILLDVTAGVCCGLAGHAIALARYGAIASDARFKPRAYGRLTSAIRNAQRGRVTGFLSLWQGTLGVALVAMRRMAGENGFPCIEGAAG